MLSQGAIGKRSTTNQQMGESTSLLIRWQARNTRPLFSRQEAYLRQDRLPRSKQGPG